MTAATAPRTDAPARAPNILTIVLDCARAKNYAMSGGGDIAKTPVLDELVARGTAFPRAVSASNWTLPSHFSLFTGTYPNVHGRRTFQEPSTPLVTSATALRQLGYHTAIFTENVYLVGGVGLEEGFEFKSSAKAGISEEEKTFVNGLVGRAKFLYSARTRTLFSRLPPLIAPLSWIFHSQEVAFKEEVCGDFTVDRFASWLENRPKDRPFYAFCNLVDTHDPYDLVPNGEPIGVLDRAYLFAPRYYLLAVPGIQDRVKWGALLRGYVRSIEAADRKLGRILALLRQQGEEDRTLIVVTSDHGQSFGEGGNAFHGCGATDSVTRVPLVVIPPKGTPHPARVERWVSLCEVDSWVRSAASGDVPFDDEGRAPVPHLRADPYGGVVYSEGAPVSDLIRSLRGIRTDQGWNHRLLAAYRGNEKFVIDLETSELSRWSMDGDPDPVLPTRLTGSEAEAVRREVFGAYETEEKARRAHVGDAPPALEREIDERLRSWGYD
jgi:arylsulfatase A-like enzyme